VAGFCEHDDEPSGSIKEEGYCLTNRVTISFSNNILHHGVWSMAWSMWSLSGKCTDSGSSHITIHKCTQQEHLLSFKEK
jgi:hypothetical protein